MNTPSKDFALCAPYIDVSRALPFVHLSKVAPI